MLYQLLPAQSAGVWSPSVDAWHELFGCTRDALETTGYRKSFHLNGTMRCKIRMAEWRLDKSRVSIIF